MILYPLAAALFVASACTTVMSPARMDGTGPDIAVTAEQVPLNPDDPAQQVVGKLRYRGGLVLRSKDARFGGLSGLRWLDLDADDPRKTSGVTNRLITISDAGHWLAFSPQETAEGQLVDIGPVRIGMLGDLNGTPLPGKTAADAESLEILDYCKVGCSRRDRLEMLVGYERDHRLWLYTLNADGVPLAQARDAGLASAFLARQPNNGGIEAIAGTISRLRLFSEDLRDARGQVEARELYCVGCDSWPNTERAFGLNLPMPFKPTDAVWSERGQFLLSRSFSQLQGVAARIDRVRPAQYSEPPGTLWHAPGPLSPLAELRPPLTIDNMEGLAVRQEGDRTFLYIVSDDNFSPLQRTLLMKFELMK